MSSKLSNLFFGLGCLTPIGGIVLLFYFLFQSSISLGVISVILSFVVTILLFVVGSQMDEKRKAKQLKFLQTFQPDQEDFQKFKSYTSYDLLSKIAIGERQGKVYLWLPDSDQGEKITKAYAGMPYIIKEYDYSNLLALKLTEDHHETASMKKDTHFTNFLLNKLNEEEKTADKANHPPVDKISSMDLEIIVNDNVKSRHLIRFYHDPHIKIRKDSPQYQAYFSECQKWFTMLQDIIIESEKNVDSPDVERSIEMIEPPIFEELLHEDSPKEKTRITMNLDTDRYALHLTEDRTEENPQSIPNEPAPEQAIEKPTSYFEQLIEKNKRQLRGDYTDE